MSIASLNLLTGQKYQKPIKNMPNNISSGQLTRSNDVKDTFVSSSTLRAYHLNPAKLSFGRTKAEHESWGAVYNQTSGKTSFKLFSFPDNQEVKVLVSNTKEPIGLNENIENRKDIKSYKMTPPEPDEANPERKPPSPGVYSVTTQKNDEIKPGDQYCFEITKKDGSKIRVPDPYSMKQPGISKWSVWYFQVVSYF